MRLSATGTGKSSYSPAVRDARNYAAWVLSCFEQALHGRILEVGLGHASYFPALRERGTYCGVDIDADLVDEARERFPDGDFRRADILDPGFANRVSGDFDAVVCFNVLEHIENHAAALLNLLAVLKPHGRVCLLVPALPMLYNDMDRLAGHRRRYTVAGLRTLASACGAALIQPRYFNALGGVGWLANRLVRHESLADPGLNRQIAFFDRWLIPVSRALDPFCSRFFGQSIVATLQRS